MQKQIKQLITHLRYISLLLLVFLVQSGLAYGCSGEGAAAFTEENKGIVTRYGVIALVLVLSITALYFVRRRKGLLAILASVAVFFFHPLWWFGGGGGDCGMGMAVRAKYITAMLGVIFAAQVIIWRIRNRHPATSSA